MECMSRNPLTLSLGDHSLQSHALSVFFFYVFHTNFTHSPCTPHVSENTCTTHFVMFAKINFFMYPIY